MGFDATAAVPIYVGGLDGTMSRSVEAFLESRHREHFSVVGRDQATILLVDLDQPQAEAEVAAAGPTQIVIGVGFAAEPQLAACRRYVQKPLNGAVLVDALSDAVTLIGTTPRAEQRPARLKRPSHARDVFTKGQAYQRPAPPASVLVTAAATAAAAPAAAATVVTSTTATATVTAAPLPTRPQPPRLDRAVHDRAPRLVEVADDGGTAGSAAEALGRRLEVEPIEARSGGDLREPEVLASYRYAPARHLDGRVRQVAAEHAGSWWELRSPMLSIVGDPTDGSMVVTGSAARLRHCCAAPLDDSWEVRVLRRPPAESAGHRTPADVLIWNLTVWCSRGRLSEAIDPLVATRARSWPDLTRVLLTPSALPVIALLAASPHRPIDVPDVLALPRTHVFVVLSALDAAGLLEGPGSGPALLPPPPATAPPAARGVLRRLLGRLRDA